MANGTHTFTINPIAASRPRVSKFGHAYFSGPYKAFKEICQTDVPEALPEGHEPSEAALRVDVECYVTRPKTTKLDFPKPDVDNYAKAILDACNGHLWVDDKQIKALYVTKDWANPGEDGYFVVSLEELHAND